MEGINDGYMMLLDEVSFGGKVLGNISEEGIDFGGDKPTYNKLFAAQVRTGPVKKVVSNPGTTTLAFQMIQLVAQHMVAIAGGKVTGEKWDAPEKMETKEGALVIKTGTGQTIRIKKVALSGLIRGKLGNSGNLYMDCEAEMLSPTDGSSPYSIEPTTPGVMVDAETVNFPKAGGTKVLRVSASGPLALSGSYTDFTVVQDGNCLVITAANNATTSPKTGTLILALVSDPSKKVTVNLTQEK